MGSHVPQGSAHQIESFAQKSGASILVTDGERRFLDANPAACEVLGLTRDEVLELRIEDMLPPEQADEIAALWTEFLAVGSMSGQFTLEPPSGKRIEAHYISTANVAPGVHTCIFLPLERSTQDLGEAVNELLWTDRRGDGGPRLTPREREVLTLLARGLTGAEIARTLYISPETVRIHVRNAREHLGAKTRTQAVALALEMGEIHAIHGPRSSARVSKPPPDEGTATSESVTAS